MYLCPLVCVCACLLYQVATAYDDFNRREWDSEDHTAEAALLAGVKLQRVLLREGIAAIRQERMSVGGWMGCRRSVAE